MQVVHADGTGFLYEKRYALPEQRSKNDHVAGDLADHSPDSGGEEDFLGFDGGLAVQGLLQDYVSLGYVENAEAETAKIESPPQQIQEVPWLKSLENISSPLLRLHQELVEFCRYLSPSVEESALRDLAVARVEKEIKLIWTGAKVEVFGSYATGLYLPTSDIDAVVLNSGCTDIAAGLKALANALLRKQIAKNVQVIAKAKVPIIKFEESESGYAFDVSFDVANGPQAASHIKFLLDTMPAMRPLVMILKVFLQQRELNEVYQGGLGSYALLVLVATHLQLHPSRRPGKDERETKRRKSQDQTAMIMEQNLGLLLVDFFRLYGRALNSAVVGISCRRGGKFFSKYSRGYLNNERPYLFAVEDPSDPDNDLGKNSYNISRVRMAFDYAYSQLVAPTKARGSLLQKIVRLDPILFARQPMKVSTRPAIKLFQDKKDKGAGRQHRQKRGS